MKPLIIINFKTYKEAGGDKALKLAKKLDQVKKNGYELAVAPSLLTIKEISQGTKLTVYAQHTDNVNYGSYTGRIPAEELKAINVKGTILNHSERKIPLKYLGEIIHLCKQKKLKIVVCASSLSEIKKVAQFKPDYLAYEPKELIGGNVSVTEAKPDIIVKAVELVKQISPKTNVLCGAGVHSKEDLGQALLLGTEGVLLSHAVVRAKNPQKFLEGMLL